jgi:nucleolar protein 12
LQISPLPVDPAAAPNHTGNKRRRGIAKDYSPARVKRKKTTEDNVQLSLRTGSTAEPSVVNSRKAKESQGGLKKKSRIEKSLEESDDEEADAGLEVAYERKVRLGKQAVTGSSKNEEQQHGSPESEAGASQLVHETAAKKDRRKKKHAHDVPPNETKEQRDARTIFLGNIPIEVAKSKVYSSPLFALAPLVLQIVSRL